MRLRDTEWRRVLMLALVMAVAVFVVTGVSIAVLYQTSFEEQKSRLREIVTSRARFIEAVARFDRKYSTDFPGGATKATLSQLIEAHEAYEGFGRTGEFVVAHKIGENIVFILRHRHGTAVVPAPVPFTTSELAEPMRRALRKESGTVVALDYRGEPVLAAYEPVQVLDLGLVAKLDLAEVRAPFVRAGMIVLGISLSLVILGALVTVRVGSPLARALLETEELRRSRTSMERAQKIAHFGNWEWDIGNGVLTWSNEIFSIFGLDPKIVSPTYQIFLDSVHPDDRARVEAAVARTLSEPGQEYRIEHRVVRPDGNIRTVQQIGTVSRTASGVPVDMVGVCHDITDRVELERETRDSQAELAHVLRVQSVSELATTLAHEINQPLTSITTYSEGSLQAINNGARDPESFRYPLEMIHQAAIRASDIVRQVRSFLRKGSTESEEMDVNRLLREATDLLLRQARQQGVALTLRLDPGNPTAWGNPTQVQQVIVNLTRNGLDAVRGIQGESPNITVRSVKNVQNNTVRIEVRDNGPGFPEDVRNQAFSAFYSTKADGLGMGLSICKTIVENAGGRIIIPEDQAGGGVVEIELPCSDRQERGHA